MEMQCDFSKKIPQSYVGLQYDIDSFDMNLTYISIHISDYNNFKWGK